MRNKILFYLIPCLFFIPALLFAGIITKPYSFISGTVIKSAHVNSDFDIIYGEVNGLLDGANIRDGSIGMADLSPAIFGQIVYVNVTDYGAVGNGIVDDTAAVDSAIASMTAGTLYFPAGHYMLDNVNLGSKAINIVGSGFGTIIEAVGTDTTGVDTANDYAFVYNAYTASRYTDRKMTDLVIYGNARAKNGIFLDEEGGGIHFDNVFFSYCNIGVCKRGAINNYFENCAFDYSNYGVKATSFYNSPASQMHAGFDLFVKCRFQICYLAGYYLNTTAASNALMVKIDQCDFEGNPGFGVFVLGSGSIGYQVITINDTWFENNHTNHTTVSIGGTTYTSPADIRIEKSAADISNITGDRLEFDTSLIRIRGISANAASAIIPPGSVVSIEDIFTDEAAGITIGSSDLGSLVLVNKGYFKTAARGILYETNPRTVITKGYTNMLTHGSCNVASPIFPAGSFVADGVLSDTCIQDTTISDTDQITTGASYGFTFNTGDYVVWSFAIKGVGATYNPRVSLTGASTLHTGTITAKKDRWSTYVGVTKEATSASHYINFDNFTGSIRLADMQVVQFTNAAEAYAYAQSLLFAKSP